jgi:hypothetical protein
MGMRIRHPGNDTGYIVGFENPRILEEKRTVEAMVGIACRGWHGPQAGLCQECSQLLDYAYERLERCPFQENKPSCVDCHVHCYRPPMREKIRAVMRYAGPRMLLRHPILAVRHLIDGWLNRPVEPTNSGRGEPHT